MGKFLCQKKKFRSPETHSISPDYVSRQKTTDVQTVKTTFQEILN